MLKQLYKHWRLGLGNVMEWYDFSLFSYLPSYMSKSFFPNNKHGLVYVFLIFAGGIVTRFVGGIIFGHMGDKHGHTRSLRIAIICMVFPTFCIGLIPSYHDIGMFAPIILLLLRIAQGVSAGGQYSGSLTVLGDLQKGGRAEGCALAYVYSISGYILASVIVMLCFKWIPTRYHLDFAWRVPFLLSALLAVLVFLSGKPIQEDNKAVGKNNEAPITTLFKYHYKSFLLSFMLACIGGVYYYTGSVYLITFMLHNLRYSTQQVFLLNAIALMLSCLSMMLFAKLSDKHGRLQGLAWSFILYILLIYPIMLVLTWHIYILTMISYILLLVVNSLFVSNSAALFCELFPKRVRYSGCALSYNLGNAIVGSIVPALLAMIHIHMPALIYLCVPIYLASAVGLLILILFRERYVSFL